MYLDPKKIIAWGLLLLLAMPLIFSVTIVLKQRLLQYQIGERFKVEFLQTITVSKQNLRWVKKEKEVIIEGKLFDVKFHKTEGDKVLLTGFFDSKEDKLVQHIKKFIQQKNKSDSPINQLVVKFLFFPIYNSHSEITLEGYRTLTTHKFYSITEKIPEAPSFSFNTPPRL